MDQQDTRCDDEKERIGGDTGLPEQHFSLIMIIDRKTMPSNFISEIKFRNDSLKNSA